MAETSAGHLSVRVEGLHARDVPFLFERQPKRMGLSLVASAAFDVAVAALVMAVGRHGSAPGPEAIHQRVDSEIVWLAQTGLGGGGGGGGNRMREPPRQAELPGDDNLTVPVEKPAAPNRQLKEPNPVNRLMIPAEALAAAANTTSGLIEPAPASSSQGSGSNDGAGRGVGDGIGPDIGPGLGPGGPGGTGGDGYRPGSGVTLPVAIYVPRPQYTADAMRARVQGNVWVECVVETNGICTKTRIVRSLDPTFGLDREALRAARLFRFRPGTRMGEPVPVLVTIELSFSLH